jgi:S-adenosylmethionine:tRNA ribosyltransferase-isomerase
VGDEARLWVATLNLPDGVHAYLASHGDPIRYSYVPRRWPSTYYQTVFATEPGSAEMPSAGRAFTPNLITSLVARGIQFAPLLLHTGVASLESHEPPYEEFFRVPLSTARIINTARADAGRVIAVGTTVVRALQTVTDIHSTVHPGEGWTCVVVTPDTEVRAVDGLITGLHEPRSSHLMMLEAIAGRRHVRIAYEEALRERYLWHEFGDEHLILP